MTVSTLTKNSTTAVGATNKTMRWLALGAIAGPVLFTLAWLVLGFISPGYTLFGQLIAPYSPISQPVSGLGLGVTAPYMNSAFVLGGLLLLVGVIGSLSSIPELSGTARLTAILLFALSPLGMMVDGIFNLESIMLHLVGFLLAAGTPIISFLIVGRWLHRIPNWRNFGNGLLVASPLTLVLLILFFATFNQNDAGTNMGIAGLTQRILTLEVGAWFVALGWLAFRRSS